MDDAAIGRLVRTIRVRTRLRKADVASRARVRQQVVSDLELGRLEAVGLATARQILRAIGAELVLTVRWRGADIDRLRDEDHARLVEYLARRLDGMGWRVAVEVTFPGGSFDILAFHPETGTLLVVEVKTALVTAEETLRRLDAKVRVARQVAMDRLGWTPRTVVRLLALQDTMTNRRRVQSHGTLFARSFPVRGVAARRWLRVPAGSADGLLLFLSYTAAAGPRRPTAAIKRVRRPRGRSAQRGQVDAPADPQVHGTRRPPSTAPGGE